MEGLRAQLGTLRHDPGFRQNFSANDQPVEYGDAIFIDGLFERQF